MDKYQETHRTWNKIASIYQEKFMDLDLYNDSYDAFLDIVTDKKASILEIGCGPGMITKYLLDKNADLKITGIDISENMIALAKKNNPTADFLTMDCREINRLGEKYDAIVGGFCIPYLSENDCQKLISDCENLLHNCGVLYLSFVSGDYKKSGYLSGNNGDRTFFYYYPLTKLEQILRTNHFEIAKKNTVNFVKSDGSNETHTILVSVKNLKDK